MMHMDRAIFDLRASVEATSLYIILCSLLDRGDAPTLENARVLWSGPPEGLAAALRELMALGVVSAPENPADSDHLHPTSRLEWRSPAG